MSNSYFGSSDDDASNKRHGNAATKSHTAHHQDDSDSDSGTESLKTQMKKLSVSSLDRRFDDMQSAIRGSKNAQKINDWTATLSEMEKLIKATNKHSMVFSREGVPNFFIRFLVEIEDNLRDIQQSKDAKRKLSATNAKAMSTLKTKLKKLTKSFEGSLAECRMNPQAFVDVEEQDANATAKIDKRRSAHTQSSDDSDTSDEETSDEEDSDEDDDDDDDAPRGRFTTAASKKKPTPTTAAATKANTALKTSTIAATTKPAPVATKAPVSKFMQSGSNAHYASDDSGQWSTDDSHSDRSDLDVHSSDDSDSGAPKTAFSADASASSSSDWSDDDSDSDEEGGTRKKGLAKWGLRQPSAGKSTAAPAQPKKRVAKVIADDQEGAESDSDVDGGFSRVVSGRTVDASKLFDLTPESIVKRVRDINESRGKKGVDRAEQLLILRKLLELARGSLSHSVHVLMTLIPLQLDYYSPLTAATAATTTSVLSTEAWKSIESDLSLLLGYLSEPEAVAYFVDSMEVLEEEKDSGHHGNQGGRTPDTKQQPRLLHGTVVSFLERLDDEWTKSLQLMDAHAIEYIDRLRDERPFYALLVRAQRLFETLHHPSSVSRCMLRRAEHLYAKHDTLIAEFEPENTTTVATQQQQTLSGTEILGALCQCLYTHVEERTRARALLFEVYHHALHDRYYRARDIYLMSRLQESIQSQDAATQILFNRAMVQLGLCAFRAGLLKEAASCLQDIALNTKFRELLGQGMTLQARAVERTVEQEKQDKLRQLPYHMHLHMELIESIYLMSAMLMEIPMLAQHGFDRSRIQSRPFKRLMDYCERQVFVGPPETNRDQLMAAARALADSDWQRCGTILMALKVWVLVSPTAAVVERVRAMIRVRVQEEALRTFLFAYSANYTSLSLMQLAHLFSLPVTTVQTTVLAMILKEELAASLDQPSGALVLHKKEQSRCQQLALQLADKAALLVESNERWIEIHSGVVETAVQQQQPAAAQPQMQEGDAMMRHASMRRGTRQQQQQQPLQSTTYTGYAQRGGARMSRSSYTGMSQRQQMMTAVRQ